MGRSFLVILIEISCGHAHMTLPIWSVGIPTSLDKNSTCDQPLFQTLQTEVRKFRIDLQSFVPETRDGYYFVFRDSLLFIVDVGY